MPPRVRLTEGDQSGNQTDGSLPLSLNENRKLHAAHASPSFCGLARLSHDFWKNILFSQLGPRPFEVVQISHVFICDFYFLVISQTPCAGGLRRARIYFISHPFLRRQKAEDADNFFFALRSGRSSLVILLSVMILTHADDECCKKMTADTHLLQDHRRPTRGHMRTTSLSGKSWVKWCVVGMGKFHDFVTFRRFESIFRLLNLDGGDGQVTDAWKCHPHSAAAAVGLGHHEEESQWQPEVSELSLSVVCAAARRARSRSIDRPDGRNAMLPLLHLCNCVNKGIHTSTGSARAA